MLKTELGIQLDEAAKLALSEKRGFSGTQARLLPVRKKFPPIYIRLTPEQNKQIQKDSEIEWLEKKQNPPAPIHTQQNTMFYESTHRVEGYHINMVQVFKRTDIPDGEFIAYKIEEVFDFVGPLEATNK